MKKLDPKTLKYIAKTYGKKYAGDESDPSESVVTPDPIPLENVQAGYDQSPEANPNVSVNPTLMAQADVTPQDLNDPAQPNSSQIDQSASHGATGSWDDTPAPKAAVTPEDPYAKAGVPNMEAGFEQEQKANQAEAKAIADQGTQEVNAIADFQKQTAALPSNNDLVNQHKAKDDEFEKSIRDNKIDPNRFLHSMSTAGKIGAGLALILSGAGAGLSHQPSLAADMLGKAIDRDIDAQKTDQSNTMNLWKMNREQLGNELAANLATQNQLMVGVKSKLASAAASAKGPLAQANAQKLNAQIDQKLMENRFKLSLMQPTSDSFGIDPAKKVSWLVPAEKQGKVFDEIDAAQNATRSAPEILKAFDQASEEARPLTSLSHSKLPSLTAFVPGMESANQKAFHTLLGPTFKDVEGTVRQAAMDNVFKSTTPQFGDDDQTIRTKRAAIEQYLQSKSAAPNASGFGINLNQYPSTNVKGALTLAPGQKPQGPNIQTMNGVKYRQVQGGWMKIQ